MRTRLPAILKKEELKPHTWYKGWGRNSNVALWNERGQYFITVGYKFGNDVTYHELHWDDDGPFQPLEEITCTL